MRRVIIKETSYGYQVNGWSDPKKLCKHSVGCSDLGIALEDAKEYLKGEEKMSCKDDIEIKSEPFKLTPPGADLDNLILRAKGIIKSYEHIQRQSKLALEEWNVYIAKLMGLHGKVGDIRKTLGVIGEKE